MTFDGDIGDLLSIKSGGMLTVACVVEGSPAPRKHWERNGQVVHDCPDYTNPRCVLVLRDVKFPENNGEYLCVGENIVKKTEKRLILVVQGIKYVFLFCLCLQNIKTNHICFFNQNFLNNSFSFCLKIL